MTAKHFAYLARSGRTVNVTLDWPPLAAAWLPVPDADQTSSSECDVALPGFQARKAWGIDIFNGTEQELVLSAVGKDTRLKGIVVKDYPTYLRLEK